jgi:type I restriction enzyme S subunit
MNESILAKAFRGELVPQDPNDEPASALLARIKADGTVKGVSTRRGRGRAIQSAE